MWVVKLGGSLQGSPRLPVWLELLAEHGRGKFIIVPGGGVFADTVRTAQEKWAISDDSAHRMSLLAMEQYAHQLMSLKPGLCAVSSEHELEAATTGNRVPIWLPYSLVAGNAELPADWRVTSDSLSLWLAIRMRAEALILIKAAAAPAAGTALAELSAGGRLDEYFPSLAPGYSGDISWVSEGEIDVARAAILNARMPGRLLGSQPARGVAVQAPGAAVPVD